MEETVGHIVRKTLAALGAAALLGAPFTALAGNPHDSPPGQGNWGGGPGNSGPGDKNGNNDQGGGGQPGGNPGQGGG